MSFDASDAMPYLRNIAWGKVVAVCMVAAGAVAITYGVWLIYRPAAFIVGGFLAIGLVAYEAWAD